MILKLIFLVSCFLVVSTQPSNTVNVQDYLEAIKRSLRELNNKSYSFTMDIELDHNGKLFAGNLHTIRNEGHLSSNLTMENVESKSEFVQINKNRFVFNINNKSSCLLVKKENEHQKTTLFREARQTEEMIEKIRVLTLRSHKRRINNLECLPAQLNENITLWVTSDTTSAFAIQQIDFKFDQSMGSIFNIKLNTFFSNIFFDNKNRFEFSFEDCEHFEYIKNADVPKTVQFQVANFLIKSYEELVLPSEETD